MKTSNKISVPLRENWKTSTGKGDEHEKGVHRTRVKRRRKMDVLGALKRESIKFWSLQGKTERKRHLVEEKRKIHRQGKEKMLTNLLTLGNSSAIQTRQRS